MQTFLPVASFVDSAKILDYRRLGKQRVEADQILSTLLIGKSGWSNHPAVKMWRGYEIGLALYRDTMIKEWISRGYRNTMPLALDYSSKIIVEIPPWVGDPEFHASHRSNLLRKDPQFYGRYGWIESPDAPYVWPP